VAGDAFVAFGDCFVECVCGFDVHFL
jgi:hypothetical protein